MDASLLFADIAGAARAPAPYRDWGVADTFEGRFERLTLLMTLVLARLRELPAPADEVGQDLVDRLFTHLDDGLRRSGIGDLSVGKRVKKLAQGFYGRAQAYSDAFSAPDDSTLKAALSRNLYASECEPSAVPEEVLAEIAQYRSALAASALPSLLQGEIMRRAAGLL